MSIATFMTSPMREAIRARTYQDEAAILQPMVEAFADQNERRARAVEQAISWVEAIRAHGHPGLMESLLAEYGLSTQEGVALMCLAEAYLRVPDADTLDELIEDKIAPQDFAQHLGHSNSMMVNASTWGLMLTGNLLAGTQEQNLRSTLRKVTRRLGEPVIRTAVKKMMRLMGNQFVLGETIESAMKNGRKAAEKGYTFSYDMLGEAARTEADANRYYFAYADAISEIAKHAKHDNVIDNPGISIKLSALHPRYEALKLDELMGTLYESIRSLCLAAKKANIGLNIDAEEVERLDISLSFMDKLLADPALAGWRGFGVVVQAYGKRAPAVIDWLYETAKANNRQIMLRLVKGAYWDREIKRSQELGLNGYAVYTHKYNTDTAYLYCADKLLGYRDVIYPQFATHNAHTVSYVMAATTDEPDAAERSYEFQRLHGMGQSLYDLLFDQYDIHCRVYAPVGVHKDLLAYLVRRLLENGANASFVNQLLDEQIEPARIVADPVVKSQAWLNNGGVPGVTLPADLFAPERANSQGFDWQEPVQVQYYYEQREAFRETQWMVAPLVTVEGYSADKSTAEAIINPADQSVIGQVVEGDAQLTERAIAAATKAQPDWAALSPRQRSECLRSAATLYESNIPELLAILTREGGKSIQDGIAEIREAVDFLNYYAREAENLIGQRSPLGVVACISPWNFPLAIFTGQLSAALAVGNAVLVKPAESTPIVAYRAVQLLHKAGVPAGVLQFVPGAGKVVGEVMSSHSDIAGLVFTGSTATAKRIEHNIACSNRPAMPLIAETGGLNAMIVDSSALPEQAIMDIIASAFQSAGQRCSALRMLYVQEDVAEQFFEMLYGAMDVLTIGDTWDLANDIGPIIDRPAQQKILDYCETNRDKITKQYTLSKHLSGFFVPPTVIKLKGIEELGEEIFGPVLHIATFAATAIDEVIAAINAKGYGLTFGLHTRLDSRVQEIVEALHIGNIYVNRNQIGAIVGSQPFGGEGLSGTGPKAGGPNYLYRLTTADFTISQSNEPDAQGADIAIDQTLTESPKRERENWRATIAESAALARAVGIVPPLGEALSHQFSDVLGQCRQRLPAQRDLPGPTGEENLYSLHPRGVILIVTSDPNTAFAQVLQAVYGGNAVLLHCPTMEQQTAQWRWIEQSELVAVMKEPLTTELLSDDTVAFDAVVFTPQSPTEWSQAADYRQALAQREGAILPLMTEVLAPYMYVHERHLCINTTASGGDVKLLAATEE